MGTADGEEDLGRMKGGMDRCTLGLVRDEDGLVGGLLPVLELGLVLVLVFLLVLVLLPLL